MEIPIRSLIVEDEKRSAGALHKLLDVCCPEIEIVAMAQTLAKAIELIDREKPDLVFLDISLPDGMGFELFEKVRFNRFKTIFTTAYDAYAIKAFELSAIHYLLKPINEKELKEAITRFKKSQSRKHIAENLSVLNNALNGKNNKIMLSTSEGVHIVEIDQIIRCEAYRNYTIFHMLKEPSITVSKAIGVYEQILENHNFCRVHSKHLVNLVYIKKYIKGQGGTIVLKDEQEILVSRNRKEDLLNALEHFIS
jgi:two-component system LytT family response regulator